MTLGRSKFGTLKICRFLLLRQSAGLIILFGIHKAFANYLLMVQIREPLRYSLVAALKTR